MKLPPQVMDRARSLIAQFAYANTDDILEFWDGNNYSEHAMRLAIHTACAEIDPAEAEVYMQDHNQAQRGG